MTTMNLPKMRGSRGWHPMVGFGVAFVMLFLVVGLFLGVSSQVLSAYKNSVNASSGEAATEFVVLSEASNATLNFASNLPTVGTMAGIGLLIAVVGFGLVALVGKFGKSGGGGGGGFG